MVTSQNSYAAVVQKMREYFQSLEPTTLDGKSLVDITVTALNKSDCPLHAVRDFIHASEDLLDDPVIVKACQYIKSLLKFNTNLNFQIGICREEHLLHLKQMLVQNPVEYLESQIPLDEFDRSEVELRESIRNGVFDSLQSNTLQSIKNRLEIQPIETVMTERGYQSIVSQISEKLGSTVAQTESGKELIEFTQRALYESSTPMIKIREFVSGAQSLMKEDTKLADVIKFCKKITDTDSLNFLVNLCKEEHFENLTKAGHPNPEKTIEEIKEYFNLPDGEIKKQIEAGVYDMLDSKLLNDIKRSLSIEIKEPEIQGSVLKLGGRLNESISCYHPVGFSFPTKEGKTKFLMEGQIFDYDVDNEMMLQDADYEPSDKIRTLGESMRSLNYDETTNSYILEFLNLRYEYNIDNDEILEVYEDGTSHVIDDTQLEQQLIEFVNNNNPNMVKPYIAEIDAFRRMVRNSSKLIKFDTVTVIKNRQNNRSVIVDSEPTTPRYVNGGNLSVFDSFSEMALQITNDLDVTGNFGTVQSIQKLYDVDIYQEMQEKQTFQTAKMELEQELKNLNSELIKLKSMLEIIEKDSPAYDEIFKQYQDTDNRMKLLIEELKVYM